MSTRVWGVERAVLVVLAAATFAFGVAALAAAGAT